jgi:hypothetical protein
MIDFRYHLISIVAVFLALGVGILMGSFVLGEGLVNQLDAQLERIDNRNSRLQELVNQLSDEAELNEGFARLMREHVLPTQLQAEEIVLFTFQGTDGALLDEIRSSVEDAGGRLVTTIEATDKLALRTPAERDQLALALSSTASESGELRVEVATEMARTAAIAAVNGTSATLRPFSSLLGDLEQAEFIATSRSDDGNPLVPPGASFVIAGGATDDPPFAIADYTISLASELSERAATVVADESSTSTWGMSTMVRVANETQTAVSTVDNGETVSGSIALVLGLEQAEDGIIGHYGVGSDAERIIPEPVPAE